MKPRYLVDWKTVDGEWQPDGDIDGFTSLRKAESYVRDLRETWRNDGSPVLGYRISQIVKEHE